MRDEKSLRGSRYRARCVMDVTGLSQPRRGILRRKIALRSAEQFKADHELADVCRPEERWVEMYVQMAFVVSHSVRRPLMESHRIWKCRFEQIVVARRQAFERIGQRIPLARIERIECGH